MVPNGSDKSADFLSKHQNHEEDFKSNSFWYNDVAFRYDAKRLQNFMQMLGKMFCRHCFKKSRHSVQGFFSSSTKTCTKWCSTVCMMQIHWYWLHIFQMKFLRIDHCEEAEMEEPVWEARVAIGGWICLWLKLPVLVKFPPFWLIRPLPVPLPELLGL